MVKKYNGEHYLRPRWRAMIHRCHVEHHKQFPDYGGRGITVCQKWHSFDAWLADMGEPPSPKHSIDRIDNEAGYFPGNCRWATRTEQNRNTRKGSRYLTHNGETRHLRDWARVIGISAQALHWRLNNGWSIADCMKPALTPSEAGARGGAASKGKPKHG
jgi:hypothetical protein